MPTARALQSSQYEPSSKYSAGRANGWFPQSCSFAQMGQKPKEQGANWWSGNLSCKNKKTNRKSCWSANAYHMMGWESQILMERVFIFLPFVFLSYTCHPRNLDGLPVWSFEIAVQNTHETPSSTFISTEILSRNHSVEVFSSPHTLHFTDLLLLEHQCM